MKRVLHFIPSLEGGGAERQLAYLAGELPKYHWDVQVALVRENGANLPRVQQAGAAVHKLPISSNHDPRLFTRVRRLIRALRPDVVQTWLLQMDVNAGMAARWCGVPFIMSERSCAAAYPAGGKTRLRRMAGRLADVIVANSAGGLRYWSDVQVPRVLIPNGLPLAEIDTAEPASDLAQYGVAPDDRLVLHAGRFSDEKNLDRLIEALVPVVTASDVKAVLCGEGPRLANLKAQVAAHGLQRRILFPGYVTDLWPWFKRADVCVSVGTFEGHPNSVAEALACGSLLVLSDIEAHRELIPEALATFVDPSSADSIGGGIRRTLARGKTATHVTTAQSYARRWALSGIASQYDEVYRDVLRRRDRRGRAS